jgi:hypothetical protein
MHGRDDRKNGNDTFLDFVTSTTEVQDVLTNHNA